MTRSRDMIRTAAVSAFAMFAAVGAGGSATGAAPKPTPSSSGLTGAVYAGTNKTSGNTVVAFGQRADGTLTPIAEYSAGGTGRSLDGTGDGLDPMISEDSVLVVNDRLLLAVNAGSNTIASFRINGDQSLTRIDTAPTNGVGPVSLAHHGGLVFVVNADADGSFSGPPDQSGNMTGFRLNAQTGKLNAIPFSTRALGVRPSDIEFSPDGRHLLISGVNAGSSMLASRSTAEVLSFNLQPNGRPSDTPATAASTLPGNSAGRNLPTAIGLETVSRGGRQFVVVSEAREFQPDGSPGMLPMFQTGSVSSWEIGASGNLTARSQDVLTGSSVDSGPTSACWLTFAPGNSIFWVASASGATISSFRFSSSGAITLINSRAASGAAADPNSPTPLANADGFIDLTISRDGRYLYQLLGLRGIINVYAVGANGALDRRQEASGLLPMGFIQGISFAANR